MPKIHPKPEALHGLMGRLPEVRRRALRHAWECPECRAVLEGAPADESSSRRKSLPDYGPIIEDILRNFQPRMRRAERERSEAPALFAELMRHPPGRREVLIRNVRRFRSFSLCVLLLDRCREESPGNPRNGEAWAVLALRLADLLDPAEYGIGLLEDIRARGWTQLANARRIVSDLAGAEQAFAQAERHLRQGTRDRLDWAHLLACKASMRRVQRRFTEAERYLRRALSIWLAAGESRRSVETLLTWSMSRAEAGDHEVAIRLLRAASEIPGISSEDRLTLFLRHNLVNCLVLAGRVLEAEGVYLGIRELYERVQEPGLDQRRRKMEALLAREGGRTAEAEELLDQVQEEYLEKGMLQDAALAALDRAFLCVSSGRAAEAAESAQAALGVLSALGVELDAFAAFLLLQRARAV